MAEVGKKLTEKWMSLLAFPGALYLAVSVGALILGHDQPWGVRHLVEQITGYAAEGRITTLGGQVVVAAAVVAGSVAVGLCARGLGTGIERVWLAEGWRSWPLGTHLVGKLVAKRRRRWTEHRDAAALAARCIDVSAGSEDSDTALVRSGLTEGVVTREPDESAFQMAYDRMAQVSLEAPERPTWCGDRLNAVSERFERDHGLRFSAVWPHLWLLLPAETREMVTAAREDLARANALVAWGVLYGLLALLWWPAPAVGGAVVFVGWARVRRATETYATLLEVSMLSYIGLLAEQMKVPYEGLLDKRTGLEISRRLSRSLPPGPGGQETG